MLGGVRIVCVNGGGMREEWAVLVVRGGSIGSSLSMEMSGGGTGNGKRAMGRKWTDAR